MAPHGTAKGFIQTWLNQWTLKPNKATIFLVGSPYTWWYYFEVLWRKKFLNMSMIERTSSPKVDLVTTAK